VLRPLGEDVTEVLDYTPASFRVIRHVRPKLSCRSCETIALAAVPSLPIERGLPTPALLAHVLVAKYADHCPLYRQAEIYARAGIELDRSTLADRVGQSASLLRPLVDAVGAHVMAADRVHADDTTVPVLDPGRGTTKTGRLWCYVRDDRPFAGTAPPAVPYRYSPDRKGEHPRSHLAGFRGILQADSYAGYGGLYQRGVTEGACMAHCRRPFFKLHASDGSPLALEALQRIAALYAVEDMVRGQPPELRLRVRQAQSVPLFANLRAWLEQTLTRISGKTDLAGAIRYMLTRWDALTLVLRDGRACIGRVEVWRGGCRLNIAVAAPFVWRCLIGSAVAPFPHPARQTGRADFPHPAFSRPVRPSLSAGRRVAVERCRGRASRRDTRPGSGGTRRPVARRGASTSDGPVAQCMLE
jgi:transposase